MRRYLSFFLVGLVTGYLTGYGDALVQAINHGT